MSPTKVVDTEVHGTPVQQQGPKDTFEPVKQSSLPPGVEDLSHLGAILATRKRVLCQLASLVVGMDTCLVSQISGHVPP